MKDKEKKMQGLLNKLSGLRQCVSEMETTEADLLMALGAQSNGQEGLKDELHPIEIEHFLFVLANAVEAREKHTHGHIERVSGLATALGRKMDLPNDDIKALRMGSVLHDIGKIGMPAYLLENPGKLTSEALEPMKNHPEIGYHLCLPLKRFLGRALDIIRQHHEKLNGTGYPHGLQGEDIYLGSRIMTVVDIYDALTTDRAYRKGMSRKIALAILHQEADEGRLDERIVASFEGLM